jgi:hypothetical protein
MWYLGCAPMNSGLLSLIQGRKVGVVFMDRRFLSEIL